MPVSFASCKRELHTVGLLHDDETLRTSACPIRAITLRAAADLLTAAGRVLRGDHRDYTPTEIHRMLTSARELVLTESARRNRSLERERPRRGGTSA